MLQFILERANYWAIIGLMMVGLYIAFQSANMIKRLVGLSIFQTSVFFFYITLGKIAGGTAPILYGKDAKGHGGEAHHGDEAGHGAAAAGHGEDAGLQELYPEGEPLTVDPAEPLTSDETEVAEAAEVLATATDEPLQNLPQIPAETPIDTANPITGLQEVYSNPLPHVLILTAIVVGVATLAVGLAIVVRIREAYGTIEADEVRDMDIAAADAQDADDAMGVSA